ncbi:MAG TPA: hypothetical protein VGD46_10815 [Rhizobacter sp.]
MLRRTFAVCPLAVAACALTGRRALAHAAPQPDLLSAATRRFLVLAQGFGGLPAAERHPVLNRHVNQLVDYAVDADVCGARDCWQTPAETLASGRGDCEDGAILKYFLLCHCSPAGGPRLVYAQCAAVLPGGAPLAHVVVIADADAADPLVLDCIDGAPQPQPLSRRADLRPLFSFDARGLWRGVTHEHIGDAAVRLLPWRGVLQRWAGQQRQAALPH